MKAFTTLMLGALVVLAAALLVPQAAGAVRPDDRAGVLGAGAIVTAQAVRPDWGEFVLGVVVVAGLALIAVALTLTVREHGGHRPVPH